MTPRAWRILSRGVREGGHEQSGDTKKWRGTRSGANDVKRTIIVFLWEKRLRLLGPFAARARRSYEYLTGGPHTHAHAIVPTARAHT